MREIIPAIMPQHYNDLEDEATRLAHYVPIIQLDIMDGRFVRAKTWPYVGRKDDFEAILNEQKGLPFWDSVDYEIDLMVLNPEEVIDTWISIGAARIVVHVESTTPSGLEKIVALFRERFAYDHETKKRDLELILALNIDTPTDAILPYLEDIDAVQFMGIATIGYQGQPFDERVIPKIHSFHNTHPQVIISIDGGVSFNNAPQLREVGVLRFVSGSLISESSNIQETVNQLRNIL